MGWTERIARKVLDELSAGGLERLVAKYVENAMSNPAVKAELRVQVCSYLEETRKDIFEIRSAAQELLDEVILTSEQQNKLEDERREFDKRLARVEAALQRDARTEGVSPHGPAHLPTTKEDS